MKIVTLQRHLSDAFYNSKERKPAEINRQPKFQLRLKPPVKSDAISFSAWKCTPDNDNVKKTAAIDLSKTLFAKEHPESVPDLQKAFESFTDREKAVTIKRFGLDGTKSLFQEETVPLFELALITVRRTELSAREKIKKINPDLITKLQYFSSLMELPEELRPLCNFADSCYAKTLNKKAKKDFLEGTQTLTPKERVVLSLRFGLNDKKHCLTKEISELFGYSHSGKGGRISTIESNALEKIPQNVQTGLHKFLEPVKYNLPEAQREFMEKYHELALTIAENLASRYYFCELPEVIAGDALDICARNHDRQDINYYLARTIRGLYINVFKKRAKMQSLDNPAIYNNTPDKKAKTPQAILDEKELRENVNALPNGLNELIELRFADELSIEQIAAAEKMTTDDVDAKIKQAIDLLRKKY